TDSFTGFDAVALGAGADTVIGDGFSTIDYSLSTTPVILHVTSLTDLGCGDMTMSGFGSGGNAAGDQFSGVQSIGAQSGTLVIDAASPHPFMTIDLGSGTIDSCGTTAYFSGISDVHFHGANSLDMFGDTVGGAETLVAGRGNDFIK